MWYYQFVSFHHKLKRILQQTTSLSKRVCSGPPEMLSSGAMYGAIEKLKSNPSSHTPASLALINLTSPVSTDQKPQNISHF